MGLKAAGSVDAFWMRQALQQASRAIWHCPPNPAVGCVLVGTRGQLLGRGHTQEAGRSHAEIMALQDAHQRGHALSDCTAYVTLEPCSHQGRTGPCSQALIEAGVGRVVAACEDPNPEVAGRGLQQLRAAGMDVTVGEQAGPAQAMNAGFFKRMQQGLPWVRLKAAISLDGRSALDNGVSQWITSDAARRDGHRWRARAGAILTGSGTVLADDPLLNVRLPGAVRQPLLAILDTRLRLDGDARLWSVPGREVLVYHHARDSARLRHLEDRGATTVRMPLAGGQLDLRAVLQDLAVRQVNEVHVEAGPGLGGGLLADRLVDELLVYQAPVLLGPGAPLAALPALSKLDGKIMLQNVSRVPLGPDLRILARLAYPGQGDRP